MEAKISNILEMKKDQLNREITSIHEQLSMAELADKPRMPERVFVNVFLPFFAGEENNIYNANLGTWINFAKTPYTEVDVVDELGNILFTVPPVYDRSTVNPVTNSRIPIAGIMATAAQHASIHPNLGLNYLVKELDHRSDLMRIPPNVKQHLARWNEIYRRYNRPELSNDPQQTSNSNLNTINLDSIGEYEDF